MSPIIVFFTAAQDIDDTLLIVSDTLPGNLKWMKGMYQDNILRAYINFIHNSQSFTSNYS